MKFFKSSVIKNNVESGKGWGVSLHTEEQKEGNSRFLRNVSKKTMEHLNL